MRCNNKDEINIYYVKEKNKVNYYTRHNDGRKYNKAYDTFGKENYLLPAVVYMWFHRFKTPNTVDIHKSITIPKYKHDIFVLLFEAWDMRLYR